MHTWKNAHLDAIHFFITSYNLAINSRPQRGNTTPQNEQRLLKIMRLCTSFLTALWVLLIVPSGWSSDAVETTPVTNAFKSLAGALRSQKPWKGWEPSKAEQQSLDQLKQLADTLMKQPNYSVAMLELLDTYRTEDGLPRQQLLDAIVESSRVQASDVPLDFIVDSS